MRTIYAAVLALAAVWGATVMGGCVSREEFLKLEAHNRRAMERLNECQSETEALKAERADLAAQLQASQAGRKSLNDQLAIARQEYRQLERKLTDLRSQIPEQAPLPTLPGAGIVLPEKVDTALRDFARQHPDVAEYLPEYGMVKFKADLTFAKGSDKVRDDAKQTLGKFVEVVNSPAARKLNVYVAGHTDDIPITRPETRPLHPNNWYLSVHRSVAVQQVLTKAGLAPERIGVLGFSKYHPVVPNAPNQGGAQANRRVELWLVPPDRFLTAAGREADAEGS